MLTTKNKIPLLQITNLTKLYGIKKGINNLSVELYPGDICGFLGVNGSGKTTTLTCIAGVQKFDKGEILIKNISIKKKPINFKHMLAYIPDSPQLYEFLTGIKYLNFICDIFAIPYLIRQERIEKLANKFELLDALSNKIETYSRGMKQKIAIIAAFIHDFDVVVLDEPFMGLDPNAIFQLKALLKEYARMGKAILFSSHVLDVVEKICTRVVIINASELVVSNTISEISKRRINLEQLFLTVTKNA